MTKPLQEVRFFCIDGMWVDSLGNVLADFLASYDLVIDDRMQFGRFYDYERRLCIYYRGSAGKVVITLWRLED